MGFVVADWPINGSSHVELAPTHLFFDFGFLVVLVGSSHQLHPHPSYPCDT